LPVEAPPSSSLSILVCEDEPLILSEISDVLRHHGHVVLETMTGTDALTHVSPSIDVIIADVSLPDMSGIELAALARQVAPNIGVIFSTGHRNVPEAGEISSAVLLVKPYGEEDIVRTLSIVLGGRTP